MPVRLTLVRHGQPAGTWGDHADPGLDEVGWAQAEAVADRLAGDGPLAIVASPLQRTRDTAVPLARRWGVEPLVEPAVGELSAPIAARPDHRTWLANVMASRYSDLDEALRAFRTRVVDALLGISADTVVFTHFLAINVAVGAATGDDRVMVFRPAHCSRTVVEIDDRALRVVDLGATAADPVHLA